jgi:hypothetical protein
MKEIAVIDAGNILHSERPRQGKLSVKNIFAVIAAVGASGREPIVIVDAAAFSPVCEVEELETLLGSSSVITVPPGFDADWLVLETAQKHDAIVVSNNTYVDYQVEYPWVELCRLPVAVKDGDVCLLEARFQKAGYRPTVARKIA